MKRMKDSKCKKLISLLLSVIMIVSLGEASVIAAGVGVSDFSDVTIEPTNAYTFKFGGKNYQMLDAYDNNGNMTFYVLQHEHMNYVHYATSADGYFHPDNNDNIGYWLNQYVLEGTANDADNRKYYTKGKPECTTELLCGDYSGKDIDAAIRQAIDKTHVWTTEAATADGDDYTFTAGIGLLSATEAERYYNRLPDITGGYYLRTVNTEDTTKAFALGYTTNKLSHYGKTGDSLLRLTYYLNDDFFINNRVDPKTMGEEVKNLIKANISLEEIEAAGKYEEEDLYEMGWKQEPELEGSISISVSQAYPGFKASVSGVQPTNRIRWYVCDTENGEYTQIDGAAGNDWAITNACANKYIKAKVLDTFSNAILVGAALPDVDTSFKPSADIDGQAAAYAFTFDGAPCQMLDYETVDGETSFYILYTTHIVQGKVDVDGTNYFNVDDPDKNSIAYWLNHELLPNDSPDTSTYKEAGGNGLMVWGNPIKDAMRRNIVTDHEWRIEKGVSGSDAGDNDYVVKAGIAMLSVDEYIKYIDRVGYEKVGQSFTRTPGSGANTFCLINTGYAIASGQPSTGVALIKPTFWLKKDFFINNKIDVATMGAEVKKMILANISREEMENGSARYSDAELVQIGYPSKIGYAENVEIFGTFAEGGILSASYDFNENGTGVASGNKANYQWYRADSVDGNYTLIQGAGNREYTLTEADVNKFIRVEVVPYDANGVICKKATRASDVKVRAKQDIFINVESLNVSGTTAEAVVNVTLVNGKTAVLVIAEYGENNSLVQMLSEDCTSTKTYDLKLSGVASGNHVEVLAIDSFGTIHPIALEKSKNGDAAAKPGDSQGVRISRNVSEGTYTVSGKLEEARLNQKAVISVADKNSTKYVIGVDTAVDGSFTKTISLAGITPGDYVLNVGAYDLKLPVDNNIYNPSGSQVTTAMSDINTALLNGTSVIAVIDTGDNAKTLGLDNKYYTKMNTQGKSKIDAALMKNTDYQTPEALYEVFYESLACTAVSQADASGMSDVTSEFASVLKFDTCLTYPLYKTLVSENSNVISMMVGVDKDNADDIRDAFEERALLEGIKTASDVATTKEILTTYSSMFDFSDYSAWSIEKIAQILTGKSCGSFKSMYDALDTAYESRPGKNNNSSGGGASGGAFGGSQTGVMPAAPAGNQIEIPEIFNDLAGYDWAKAAIESLYEKEIVSGDGDGGFAPERTITREEFVVILLRAFNLFEKGAAADFADITSEHWAYEYVACASSKGIVNGISAEEFGVGRNITREDMAVLIARAAEVAAIKTEPVKDTAQLTDAEDISDYAKDAVDTMCRAEIIKGYEDGSFKPKNNATRAEAAVMIDRLL